MTIKRYDVDFRYWDGFPIEIDKKDGEYIRVKDLVKYIESRKSFLKKEFDEYCFNASIQGQDRKLKAYGGLQEIESILKEIQ